jgi:hypothetical protein
MGSLRLIASLAFVMNFAETTIGEAIFLDINALIQSRFAGLSILKRVNARLGTVFGDLGVAYSNQKEFLAGSERLPQDCAACEYG